MRNFNLFLFSFLFSAFIWGIGLLFLEKFPSFYIKTTNPFKFYYINLYPLFSEVKISKSIEKIETLNGIILKGIYSNGKNGFIIIEENRKTKFINLGEYYKGYKLTFIGKDFAIFKKGDKEFRVSFKKEKNNAKLQNIESKNIDRKTFLQYKNNLSKIWKNIGIIKDKEGYKITFIRKGSIFEKIGLKKGDILLEINGKKLKNDADAWELYKNADKYDSFDIKLKRDNQIKEIYYEIY